MRLGFLITGLVILLAANILMVYYKPGTLGPTREGFSSYMLADAAPSGKNYEAIGAFDGKNVMPPGSKSKWRYTSPDEPLMGPEFKPGPDSLFIFKNNQCKPECCGASFSCGGGCVCTTPEQRQLIAGRGGNRTEPAGDF
jgi:hypothetical protein